MLFCVLTTKIATVIIKKIHFGEVIMAKAWIDKHKGEPAIFIDGVPFPPMTATICSDNEDYYKRLGDTGIKIYYITVNMRWNKPKLITKFEGVKLIDGAADEGINGLDGVEETYYKLEQILKTVPDAYIILRLNVSPNLEWINAHPEEQLLYNDGKHYPTLCTSASLTQKCDGMISFASQKWREEGAKAIREYIEEISHNPLFDRVIGCFLCAGGTSEWYYPGDIRLQNDEKELYADFSKPFRISYGNFLRKKYGTEENLRRAWNRNDATFENPLIPDLEARSHIYRKHKYIADKFMHFAHLPNLKVGNGVFLDANKDLHSLDFFLAQNEATADTIVHFAKVLKEIKPDLLVGAFYGAFGCSDYYGAANVTAVPRILDSGSVDFLATPNVYNNREPGGVAAQREMQDSLRLRNMILISEDDTRTHRTTPNGMQLSMKLFSVDDSITVLKRDFARDICEDIQGWWFDMGGGYRGVDWYDDPDILNLFKEQQEIAKLAYSLDRTKKNEIAIFYDNESVHLVSDYTDKLVLDFFRTSDIHRIGAPVDYYFHEDISHSNMPDYKLYIMLNTYCLNDKERADIITKARKNNATILWMYAPGYVNIDSKPVMDVSNIENTIGMKISRYDGTIIPNFKVEKDSHKALELAKLDKEYGFIDRNVHSNVWQRQTELELPFVNPGFYIEETDGVEVLGRYCADGKVAYALKKQDGYTSAYCTTQVIRNDLIASLAKYAGCHIFTESEDVLFANENFVCIHASYTGKRRVSFKKSCSPYEVYEKKKYGENVEYLDLVMKLGETKMFYLK